MRELKPCPFCNERVSTYSMKIEDGDGVTELEINCHKCGVEFRIRPNILYATRPNGFEYTYYPNGDAIDIWNRRYGEDENDAD